MDDGISRQASDLAQFAQYTMNEFYVLLDTRTTTIL